MKQLFFQMILCLLFINIPAQVFFMDSDFIKKNKIDNVLIKKEKNGEECNHQYFNFFSEYGILLSSYSFEKRDENLVTYVENTVLENEMEYEDTYSLLDFYCSMYLLYDVGVEDKSGFVYHDFITYSGEIILNTCNYFRINYSYNKIDSILIKSNGKTITEVYNYDKINSQLISSIEVWNGNIKSYSYNFYYNSKIIDKELVENKIDSLISLKEFQRQVSGGFGYRGEDKVPVYRTFNIRGQNCSPFLIVNIDDYDEKVNFYYGIGWFSSEKNNSNNESSRLYHGLNYSVSDKGEFSFNLPKKVINWSQISSEISFVSKEKGSYEYRLNKDEMLITTIGNKESNKIEKASFLFTSEDDYIKSLGGYSNLKAVIEEGKDNKMTQKVEKQYKIYNSIY